MFSEKKRWVWVGINKTATTSFNHSLRKFGEGKGWKHLTIQETIDKVVNQKKIFTREEFDNCFKFTIFRNPLDRAVSLYRYKLSKGSVKESSFGKWFENTFMYSGSNKFKWQQYHWITYDGRIRVDFIGLFEELQDSWEYICKRIGIRPTKLPVKKSQRKVDYREYYDKGILKVAKVAFNKDLTLADKLGYDVWKDFEDIL